MIELSTVPDWMNTPLEDWAWWVRDRKGAKGRCRSIEHRYMATSLDEDKRQPKRVVNAAECLQIEKTIVHPDFPVTYRKLIVSWYVHRSPRNKICKRAGIPMSDLEFMMGKAAQTLFNRMKNKVDTNNQFDILRVS